MKLAFSTLGVPGLPLTDVLALATAHGYHGVELRAHPEEPVHPGLGPAERTAVAAESEAAGMNSVAKAVISNTLTSADWNNTTLLKGDAVELVRGLKAEEGGTIYVFGSADLLASLLAYGLVDEYRICIAPILLGKGTPLFKTADASTGLELIEARGLENGGVLLSYRPTS